jgi:hypothetical protein
MRLDGGYCLNLGVMDTGGRDSLELETGKDESPSWVRIPPLSGPKFSPSQEISNWVTNPTRVRLPSSHEV